MTVLLDTNIAIAYVSGDESIHCKLQSLENNRHKFTFSVITKAELISGSKSKEEDDFIAELTDSVLYIVDNEVASLAGIIRKEQKIKYNRSVKMPDALIAATAIRHQTALFTNDKGLLFAGQYGVNVITL